MNRSSLFALGSCQLSSNNGQYFLNTRSNDLMLLTKYHTQHVHVSPYTFGSESVMRVSHSNVRIVGMGGLDICSFSNVPFNALRLANSNSYRNASVQASLVNDSGALVIGLNSSTHCNGRDLAFIKNTTGSLVMSPECGTSSVFLASNTGYVGINIDEDPQAWLHVRGDAIIGHANAGGRGGTLTLANETDVPYLGNSVGVLFNLGHSNDAADASITTSYKELGPCLTFETKGIERLNISPEGRIGIGTYTTSNGPVCDLHVIGPDSGNIQLGKNDDRSYSIRKDGTGALKFYRGPWDSPTLTLNLTHEGNIGIGCTEDEEVVTNLHIAPNSNTLVAGIHIGCNNNMGFNILNRHDGAISFFSGDWTVNRPPSLCILSNNNIGVWTGDPVAPLHVRASASSNPLNNAILVQQEGVDGEAIIGLRSKNGAPYVSFSVLPPVQLGSDELSITALDEFAVSYGQMVLTDELYVVRSELFDPIGWCIGAEPSRGAEFQIRNAWDWSSSVPLVSLDRFGCNLDVISVDNTDIPTLTLRNSNAEMSMSLSSKGMTVIGCDVIDLNMDSNAAIFRIDRRDNAKPFQWLVRNNPVMTLDASGALWTANPQSINFTGQHRCYVSGISSIDALLKHEGRIVVADKNEYVMFDGDVAITGKSGITQNNALPVVSISSMPRDKRVFGVISAYRDDMSNDLLSEDDVRAQINSVGEGALWVSDANGPIESGDYITTSQHLGFGMKQDEPTLVNYTVAKATMDCDFTAPLIPLRRALTDSEGKTMHDPVTGLPRWETVWDTKEPAYELRYILRVSDEIIEITKDEYEVAKLKGEADTVFRVAFIGCTYHCG